MEPKLPSNWPYRTGVAERLWQRTDRGFKALITAVVLVSAVVAVGSAGAMIAAVGEIDFDLGGVIGAAAGVAGATFVANRQIKAARKDTDKEIRAQFDLWQQQAQTQQQSAISLYREYVFLIRRRAAEYAAVAIAKAVENEWAWIRPQHESVMQERDEARSLIQPRGAIGRQILANIMKAIATTLDEDLVELPCSERQTTINLARRYVALIPLAVGIAELMDAFDDFAADAAGKGFAPNYDHLTVTLMLGENFVDRLIRVGTRVRQIVNRPELILELQAPLFALGTELANANRGTAVGGEGLTTEWTRATRQRLLAQIPPHGFCLLDMMRIGLPERPPAEMYLSLMPANVAEGLGDLARHLDAMAQGPVGPWLPPSVLIGVPAVVGALNTLNTLRGHHPEISHFGAIARSLATLLRMADVKLANIEKNQVATLIGPGLATAEVAARLEATAEGPHRYSLKAFMSLQPYAHEAIFETAALS